ncbi:cytochrome P450 [Calothrix rhizosoleniae]|uniref:cytochrome P450 n=1 Tax=Calothrix rhizosoleniae TaxID=888997 RepID=UPI000B49D747|nr:cytochrome P450 [Calothrix rhizosoleniae]
MTTSAINIKKTPPVLRGRFPYLGYALELQRNPIDFLQRGQEQFGEIFSFLLAGSNVTFLTGYKANEAFFRAADDQFSQKEAYQFTVPIFGKGIAYDTTPDRMSEQLGFIFPALREERMQAYAGFMATEAQAYFDTWGESGEVDLLAAMNELTVFIASRCLIGHEFRQHLSTEFASLYHDLEGGINLLAFFQPYLPLPSFRRRDKARTRMVELISQIIANRRAKGNEGEDFLQALMNARYADGTTLSEDNITGLLLTLLFAGQHTSAVLAAWTGILLLQHPQYLPAIMAEQQAVFGNGKTFSLERLRQLVILERSIKEAERLRPPLIMLMRKILRDFEYNGYHVKAGGLAMVSPAVSHRLPECFRFPNSYDPDRFNPERAEDRKSTYALIGFGGGRHRCIGQAFAYQQIKVIWSVLLGRFDLELVHQNYEPDYTTFVVGPRQPCLIRYKRKYKSD